MWPRTALLCVRCWTLVAFLTALPWPLGVMVRFLVVFGAASFLAVIGEAAFFFGFSSDFMVEALEAVALTVFRGSFFGGFFRGNGLFCRLFGSGLFHCLFGGGGFLWFIFSRFEQSASCLEAFQQFAENLGFALGMGIGIATCGGPSLSPLGT